MTWRVGPESTKDGRTLEEVVRNVSLRPKDFTLISWIGDDSRFGVIPYTVWPHLLHCVDGVGLSLSIDPHNPTTRSAADVEKTIEFQSAELEFDFKSTDLDEATNALLHVLERPPAGRGVDIWIGRYSRSGQFNLQFPQLLVGRLAAHQVSLWG